MLRRLILLAGIILSASNSAQAATLPKGQRLKWTDYARHVGMSETTRTAALRELRKIKELNSILIQALETNERALAVDVISALQMPSMVPTMIERMSIDDDGVLTLGINSLLSTENKDLVFSTYTQKLNPDRPALYSPATMIAMLEPLGRLGHVLPRKTVQSLMNHGFPEVRSAALSYLRAMALQHGQSDQLDLLTIGLSTNWYQVRVQTLFLIQELGTNSKLKSSIHPSLFTSVCRQEKNAIVKKQCNAVAKEYAVTL